MISSAQRRHVGPPRLPVEDEVTLMAGMATETSKYIPLDFREVGIALTALLLGVVEEFANILASDDLEDGKKD